MKTLVNAILLAALISLLSACNAAGSPSKQLTVEQQAGTMVAATMNALGAATPFASPAVATATATTQPTLFINAANASCRRGPSPDFQVIATYPAGTTVNLVGRDSVNSYWIVQDPTSHDQCWIGVQDATPAGSFDLLPEMTPQPVNAAAPGKPSKGIWNYACDNTTLTTLLGWRATTGTVNGYRIYRQGNQIADLPGTETSYTEKVAFRYGSSMQYSVAAYNEAGMSPQLTWDFHCP
jgi:hypothetical protein